MEGRLLIYHLITAGVFAGSLHLADSKPRSLTTEEVIAQCSGLAQQQMDALKVPTINGHVDATVFPASHPCRYTYFVSNCKAQVRDKYFNACVNNLKGR